MADDPIQPTDPVQMPQAQAPPPAPVAPQVTQAPPTAQQADVAHSALVGHGFKSLVSSMGGSTTQYQQTPNGPVPVQVKNSGGDFFRHILAGAILGGAAGGEKNDGSGAGWGGAARGAGAVQANDQQQQQARAAQAQAQFQNKLTADKAAQEANSASTEDTLRKAQIGMYNLQKVKDLADIQRGSYNDHETYVNNAKPIVSTYEANGLSPIRQDVSEEDHATWLKDHPGDSTLDWQPVGLQNYVDKSGNTAYQTVWNAYDPKGKINLSSSVLADWKKSGLLSMRPDLAAALKPDANGNTSLPYTAFINLQQQANQIKATNKANQQDDYTVKEQKANLEHLAAQAASERAAAAASGSEGALRNFELTQEKSMKAAQTNLSKKGWEGLTPEDKVALQPQVQKDINDIRSDLSDPLLKQQLNSNDPDVVKLAQERATDLHQRLDAAQSRSIFVPQTASKTATPAVVPNFEKADPPTGAGIPDTRYDAGKIEDAVTLARTIPKDKATSMLWSAPTLSTTEKKAIYQKLSQPEPAPGITLPNASER